MQHSTAWRAISCKNTFLLPHMLLPVLTDFSVFFCSLLLPAGHISEMLFSLLFSRSGVLCKKPASGLIFLPFFHLLLFFPPPEPVLAKSAEQVTICSFRIVRVAVFFLSSQAAGLFSCPRAQAGSVYLQYVGFFRICFFCENKSTTSSDVVPGVTSVFLPKISAYSAMPSRDG